jgi:hypothetical protein
MLLNQSFEEKLKRELSYKFKSLEKQRRKESRKWIILKFLLVLASIFLSFFIVNILSFLNESQSLIKSVFFLVIHFLILLLFGFKYLNIKKKKSKFYISFREELLNNAFKVVGLKVNYKINTSFSKEDFLESSLYGHYFNHFHSEDVVSSDSSIKSFKLGEVHAFSKGSNKSGSVTVFKGLFMKSKVDNSNEGYLVFRQKSNGLYDQLKNINSSLNDMFIGLTGNKKKEELLPYLLNDKFTFLNKYDVFCDNPAMVDTFINKEFSIRLKSYLNKYSNINFSIINDQLFVAFPQSKNLLDININKPISDQINLEKEILNYINIVDFLSVFAKDKS